MSVNTPIFIPMIVASDHKVIPLSVSDNTQRISLNVGVKIEGTTGSPYVGPYEVVPGDEVQTLNTKGLYATENIVINKIPSNYGKIAWDGSVLSVS